MDPIYIWEYKHITNKTISIQIWGGGAEAFTCTMPRTLCQMGCQRIPPMGWLSPSKSVEDIWWHGILPVAVPNGPELFIICFARGDEEQQSLAQLCNSHYWFPISCLNRGWSSTFHRPFNRLNSLWGADGPQRRLSTSIGSTNVSSMEKNHPLQSAVHVPLNLQPVRHIIMYCSHNYRRGIHSQHVVRQMLW